MGWEREHISQITTNRNITNTENFMIIPRHTNSDLLHTLTECTCSLSPLTLMGRHAQIGWGLRAAAASSPHFFVDVLLQLKLWLVGLLHGPVLQFSETEAETVTWGHASSANWERWQLSNCAVVSEIYHNYLFATVMRFGVSHKDGLLQAGRLIWFMWNLFL